MVLLQWHIVRWISFPKHINSFYLPPWDQSMNGPACSLDGDIDQVAAASTWSSDLFDVTMTLQPPIHAAQSTPIQSDKNYVKDESTCNIFFTVQGDNISATDPCNQGSWIMNQLRKAKLASIHAAVILIKHRRSCYNAFPILAIYHTKCTCK